MNLLVLLVLLGCFGWLAVWTDRRIHALRQKRQAVAARATTTETKNDQGGQDPRRQLQDDVQAFRTWAAVAFANQPLIQQWLAELSDEAIQLLTDKLTDFCTDLRFRFDWLLADKMEQDTTLARHLQTIVLHYIEACYQAYMVQDDVKAFQAWQDFTQHPYRQDHQALAQRLFAQLLEQGLTPAAAHSLLTAPEMERTIYIVQAVREAAEKRPDAFRAVLKAVLTANSELTPSPVTIMARLKRTWLRRPGQAGQSATTTMSS